MLAFYASHEAYRALGLRGKPTRRSFWPAWRRRFGSLDQLGESLQLGL
jgi:hypothetical protein